MVRAEKFTPSPPTPLVRTWSSSSTPPNRTLPPLNIGRNSTNHIQPLISWEVPTAKGRFRGINQTNICCNKPSLLLNPPQPSLYKGGSSSPDKGRLGGVALDDHVLTRGVGGEGVNFSALTIKRGS